MLFIKLAIATIILSTNLFIAFAQNSGLAVVIIDMQPQFYSNSKELNSLIEHQQQLIQWSTEQNIPVIIFEYQNMGDTDPRLMSYLNGHEHLIVEKITDGAFDFEWSSIPAYEYLRKWKVDTIIVSGINGNACVVSTINGALAKSFRVITSNDLIGNFNLTPPIYPDDRWHLFLRSTAIWGKNFMLFDDLKEIIE